VVEELANSPTASAPLTVSPSAEPAASLDEFSFGFEGWGDA